MAQLSSDLLSLPTGKLPCMLTVIVVCFACHSPTAGWIVLRCASRADRRHLGAQPPGTSEAFCLVLTPDVTRDPRFTGSYLPKNSWNGTTLSARGKVCSLIRMKARLTSVVPKCETPSGHYKTTRLRRNATRNNVDAHRADYGRQ